MKKNSVVRLTESGILLAFAIVLSFVKLVDLPFGGSITACSMLPIALIAYRHGTAWGLLSAFAFSLVQLLDGMKNLQFATSVWAVLAIILLDYIIAFVVLGLCGVFRKVIPHQGGALTAGLLLACFVRYLCHVISGCTVWAGISIPTVDGLLFSMAYNATYMIPETLICIIGAVYVSRLLDFRGESLTRTVVQRRLTPVGAGLSAATLLGAAAGAVTLVAHVFATIQGESGFDITQLAHLSPLVTGISAAVIVVCLGLNLLVKRLCANTTESAAL